MFGIFLKPSTHAFFLQVSALRSTIRNENYRDIPVRSSWPECKMFGPLIF